MRRGVLPICAFPKGWFTVALSHEVKSGTVLKQTFCGEEIVIFRTESGKISVLDAYCTHLGAHLGHGGTVEGENIRCPFHGFCFDTKGDCTKTGYGTKAPKTKIYNYPVIEHYGIILAYFDPERNAPDWSIPEVEMAGWLYPKFHTWQLESRPQEIAENSVDIGHFSEVHKYTAIQVHKNLETDGPFLTAKYSMERQAFAFSKSKKIYSEFEIHQWGLGYARVEVSVPAMNLRSRQFVLATPIDEKNMFLRIGMSIQSLEKSSQIHPLLTVLPKGLVESIVLKAGIKGYIHDVYQDFKIWQNKKVVHPPALAEGDGPIMPYRKWVKQFEY
jgi:phenylpropionate dioxygenase-like ring-hydroxylating dioxygenase large terminal subunit